MQIRFALSYILGVAIVILFIIPFFTYRVLNIGNMTGMAVGILIVLIAFLYQTKSEYTKNILFKLGLGGMGIIFLIALFLSGLMIGSLFKKPKAHATVVVLGAKVIGERPSLVLEERLLAAKRYLDEHQDAVAILSGGQGADEIITEAEGMYRYLIELGVAKERLIKEERSTTTAENLKFSREIIEERGLSSDLAIVSSEFHIFRAMHIAKEMGLDAGSVPSKSKWWLFPTYYVREMYGILYEWVW